jgi:hypothetical protein
MFIQTSAVLVPPASWQVEQEPVTFLWFIAAVGTGNAKSLADAVLVVTAGSKTDGVLPAWQSSQVVEVGKCDVDDPVPVVGGITIMLNVPWNGPVPLTWHALHPFVTPWWLNLLPAKLVVVVVSPVRLSTWHDSQLREAIGM